MIDIDIVQHINAVHRQVGTRVLEPGEARTVILSRAYHADLDDVWDAVTSPERIPRWFLPISGDLRPGGHYQLEGNASGTIERCDPPNGFAATWEFGGEVTWIEVRLTAEAAGRTRVQLEHIAHVGDERWAEFGPGAVGVGWDLSFMGLARHLESGEPVDPHAFMHWLGSEEGKQLMTRSSQLWGEAHIAAGADRSAAQAATDRTTAFYTGSAPASVSGT